MKNGKSVNLSNLRIATACITFHELNSSKAVAEKFNNQFKALKAPNKPDWNFKFPKKRNNIDSAVICHIYLFQQKKNLKQKSLLIALKSVVIVLVTPFKEEPKKHKKEPEVIKFIR